MDPMLLAGGVSSFSFILALILLPALTFVIQKVIKEYRRFAVLKALPGPPRSSLLAGNLDKFFDPKDSAGWHQHLTEKYGSAVRLTGPLGVSS